jgi:hypothetical protein
MRSVLLAQLDSFRSRLEQFNDAIQAGIDKEKKAVSRSASRASASSSDDEPQPKSKASSKQARLRTPTTTPRQSHSSQRSRGTPVTPISDSFSDEFAGQRGRGTMRETELLSDSEVSPLPLKRTGRSTAKSPLEPPARPAQRRSPGIYFQATAGRVPDADDDGLGLTDFLAQSTGTVSSTNSAVGDAPYNLSFSDEDSDY